MRFIRQDSRISARKSSRGVAQAGPTGGDGRLGLVIRQHWVEFEQSIDVLARREPHIPGPLGRDDFPNPVRMLLAEPDSRPRFDEGRVRRRYER